MQKYAFAIFTAALVVLTGLAALPGGAARADTGDVMYAVGSEIQPGTYKYTVVGNDMGQWTLCRDANCDISNGVINMDTIDGEGHTGYLTVPPTAKYVKLYYLNLTRVS
jgi:hypothetical protein